MFSPWWGPQARLRSNWRGSALDPAPNRPKLPASDEEGWASKGVAWSDVVPEGEGEYSLPPVAAASIQQRQQWDNPDVASLVEDGHGFEIEYTRAKRPSGRKRHAPAVRSAVNTFLLGRKAARRVQVNRLGRPAHGSGRDAWEAGFLTETVLKDCPRLAAAFLTELYPVRKGSEPRTRADVVEAFTAVGPTAEEQAVFNRTVEWLDGVQVKPRTGRPRKPGRPTKAAAAKRRYRARKAAENCPAEIAA
jgi:hypothetical protein